MAYFYANPNPLKKHTNDCVVRAISLAECEPWEDVYMDLCMQGLALGDMPSSNSTWGTYLKEKGYTQGILPNTCPLCYTLKDFCIEHPYGTYIVATGSHAICVMSGNYYDITDSGSEIVTYYFYKEEY